MSYFKKFRVEFFKRILDSNAGYTDDQLYDIEVCFDNAAKEIMVIKKKEDNGYQAQKNPKLSDTMSPHQVSGIAKNRNEMIANWIKEELGNGKTISDLEEEVVTKQYGNFGKKCLSCSDGFDLRVGDRCNACGRKR